MQLYDTNTHMFLHAFHSISKSDSKTIILYRLHKHRIIIHTTPADVLPSSTNHAIGVCTIQCHADKTNLIKLNYEINQLYSD